MESNLFLKFLIWLISKNIIYPLEYLYKMFCCFIKISLSEVSWGSRNQ